MKDIKVKDIWNFIKPKLNHAQTLMLFYYMLMTLFIISTITLDPKLNTEHYIRNCIIGLGLFYGLSFMLWYGLIGKALNRIGNITIFKGDEDEN